MFRFLNFAFCIAVVAGLNPAIAQVAPPPRPRPKLPPPARVRPARRRRPAIPIRPVTSRRRTCLTAPIAPVKADGNFILGPTHNPAPEMAVQEGVPQGDDLQLHHGIGRQQDLSRHRARARHVWHGRPNDPAKLDRHHQPPRSLHPPRGGLCPQAVRPRHRRAVHRRRRRTRPRPVHGAGQSDRPAPRAGDDRHLHRQRQRRRPGKPARPGIRHHVGPVRGVRREGSAASRRKASQRETHQRSRGPRDHGRQFRRLVPR